MELALATWTVFALMVVTLLALFNRLLLGKNLWKTLPPGSLGWPLIGETIAFYRSLNSDKPHKFHNTRRKRFGSTFLTNYFGMSITVVSTAEVAKDLLLSSSLKTGYLESTRQMLGTESLVLLDGERHTQVRKIIQPFLMPEKLKTLLPVMEKSAVDVIAMVEGDATDIVLFNRKYAFNVVCKVFMGAVPDGLLEDMEEAYPWIKKGLLTFPINLPGTTYRKSLQARQRIDRCIQKMVDQKREELRKLDAGAGIGSTDLASYLINFKSEDGSPGMSDKGICDLFMTMLIAGIDTTAIAISFGMMWLAENPDTLKQVREEQIAIRQRIGPGTPLSWKNVKEMEFTTKVLQETVRLTFSPFGIFRQAKEDIPIRGGYTIPKGMTVDISILNLHTDTRVFGSDAHKFRVSRWKDGLKLPPAQYMPFGYGSKACVGMDLAKFEFLTFYHYLLTTYSYEIVERPTVGFFPEATFKSGLKIRLTRL